MTFRAWKKSTKEMYYPKLNEKLTKGVYVSKSGAREYLSNLLYGEDYICMEYIGLKDDIGKDIFYNDIVKFEIYEDCEIITGTALVVYNSHMGAGLSFDIKNIVNNLIEVVYSEDSEDIIDLINITKLKVIGNIFKHDK